MLPAGTSFVATLLLLLLFAVFYVVRRFFFKVKSAVFLSKKNAGFWKQRLASIASFPFLTPPTQNTQWLVNNGPEHPKRYYLVGTVDTLRSRLPTMNSEKHRGVKNGVIHSKCSVVIWRIHFDLLPLTA